MLSELIKLIRSMYGEGEIKLHPANITWEDRLRASQIERVDCYGSEVTQFEEMLKEYTGAKHVIATCSGTAALYAVLLWQTFGDVESYAVPNYTFLATLNAISHTPLPYHIEDIETQRLSMITISDNTIPVWVFGMCPFDLNGEIVIEDAAEALGSFVGRYHAGTLGNAGILSFNGNKILTTGGGGAVLTDDDKLAENIRHFITRGFNLRMPALNAALGIPQLKRIEDTIADKRDTAHLYHQFFEGTEIRCVKEPEGCRSNYWLNTIVMPDQTMRDEWFDGLKAVGIEARKGFELLDPEADTPVAKEMAGRILNLPSGVKP